MAEPLPFEDVYDLYCDRVYRFCVSILGDLDLAEDVTAEVFMYAFKAYPKTCPEPDGVRAWLFRIARNAAISHLRRERRLRLRLGTLGREQRTPDDVETMADIRADLGAAIQALSELRRRDRTLISLRIAAGLTFREIGELMGVTEHAAQTATQRALQRVRRKVKGLPP